MAPMKMNPSKNHQPPQNPLEVGFEAGEVGVEDGDGDTVAPEGGVEDPVLVQEVRRPLNLRHLRLKVFEAGVVIGSRSQTMLESRRFIIAELHSNINSNRSPSIKRLPWYQ